MTEEEIKKLQEELKKKEDALKAKEEELAKKEDPEKAKEDERLKGLDDETKKYIRELREENKKRRKETDEMNSKLTQFTGGMKQALGITDDKEDPAKKVERLLEEKKELEEKQKITELAYENDVPASEMEYFHYLLIQASDSLSEDQDKNDRIIKEIAAKAKKVATGGSNKTSTGGKTPPAPSGEPGDGKGGTVKTYTLEEFVSMDVIEKNELYVKDRKQFDKLLDAKQTKDMKSKGGFFRRGVG